MRRQFVSGAHHEWYDAESPRPQGAVDTRRPAVEWPIVPRGERRIERVRISLNDNEVAAAYDPMTGMARHVPDATLSPGLYRVSVTVEFDEGRSAEQEWIFVVRPAPLAPPTLLQRALHAEVNAFRRLARLPAASLDLRMCAAAQEHSAYLLRRREIGHEQRPDVLGFTGATPADRLLRWGFLESGTELLQAGARTPQEAVTKLAHAPYHRLTLLAPGTILLGAGNASDRWAVLCGASERSEIVLYPSPNQSDVPCSWDGNETPSPLRLFGGAVPVGFPISWMYYEEPVPRIRVRHAELRLAADDRPVPCFVSLPGRDEHLHSAALLIPRDPLTARTAYRARVLAHTVDGADLSREWTFRTGRG